MKRLALGVLLALLAALGFASPVAAIEFQPSWSSEVTGRGYDPAIRDFVTVHQALAGSGAATLSSTPTHVVRDFSTQVGAAHVELARAMDFGMAEHTLLPFDAPPILRGGAGPGLYPSGGGLFVTRYQFVGTADHPRSFVLRAVQPGSTVAPEFLFVGTAKRTVTGEEPGSALVACAVGIVAFLALNGGSRAR